MNDPVEANRLSWDYANNAFSVFLEDYSDAIKNGFCAIPSYIMKYMIWENKEKILHIMCNDGVETNYISWLTGLSVDGVDFSSAAIEVARRNSERLADRCSFYVDDYGTFLLSQDEDNYATCFTSYGSIKWIMDIEEFMASVARTLVQGGKLLMWDFHFATALLDPRSGQPSLEYPVRSWIERRDYGVLGYKLDEEDFVAPRKNSQDKMESVRYSNDHPVYVAKWTFGDIINAAMNSGLQLVAFDEYDHIYREAPFPCMVKLDKYHYAFDRHQVQIPLTMSILFEKQ